MNKFARRLRALWRRKQLDRDLEDELAFHLAMKTGETGDPAIAQREFGNLTAFKESCREIWMFASLESWWQDVGYAVRTLRRSPMVTGVAIGALALGIGANTTIFTVVSSALSFNMGVDEIERLVMITAGDSAHRDRVLQSFPDFRDFRSQIKSIADLAAYRYKPVNVSDSYAVPERYACVQMTVSGWRLMTRKPLLGRRFNVEDERLDATPAVVLSHRVWQNRYGQDPSILGKSIRVDEVPRVVIGVMPAGIQFPEDTDIWTPLTAVDAIAGQSQNNLVLFGRLAHNVSVAGARSEVDAIARRLASRSPDRFSGLVADVHPFLEMIGVYAARRVLVAVICAVAFVLLIVCADVANLQLARAAERVREISIRVAIGAGRARIMRQLLIENVLLAAAGGLCGWLVALAGLHWFDSLTSHGPRPSWIEFSMNARAFGYLAAVSIGAGILFGLAPALQLAKVDVNTAIKEGGRGAQGGMRGQRLSGLLVVFQMMLCVILLAGAGLMIHSSVILYNAPLHLDPSNVLTMRISLPEAKYARRDDQISFFTRLKSRLESLPGVEVASVTSNLPVGGWLSLPGLLERVSSDDSRHSPEFSAVVTGSDYFRVMRVGPRRGRLFTDRDGLVGPPTALINESFAAKFWPGEDPLGKRFRTTNGGEAQPWITVVGVVPDIPQGFRRPLQVDPLIYLPYSVVPQASMFVIIRTAVPPHSLAGAARRAVQGLDENLPVQETSPLSDRIARQRLDVTAFGTLFSIFAFVALLLASIGLYAVIANATNRRTQEIGIRMAVGAGRREILRLVLSQGLRYTALGLALGLPVSFIITRVLRGALVGVSPGDPLTFAAVIVVLVVAGLLGCAVPARRAVQVDPVVALRFE